MKTEKEKSVVVGLSRDNALHRRHSLDERKKKMATKQCLVCPPSVVLDLAGCQSLLSIPLIEQCLLSCLWPVDGWVSQLCDECYLMLRERASM